MGDSGDSRLLSEWRGETPGCSTRVHLNNAGAALQPLPVLRAVEKHLQREAEVGGYEAADEAQDEIQSSYVQLGGLLNAQPRNMAIVENATVAVAQALSAFDFRPGDRIVTSRLDYPSNQIMYLSLARRWGIEVVRAKDRPEGGVDPESVRQLARHPRCRLVALTWVPTNSGLVQDVQAVGTICYELGVPYLVDACQAVGQLAVDVHRLRCDYLAGTARKFLRGPRGIGFLYVADHALDRGDFPLFLDMRGGEWLRADNFRPTHGAKRFENWEFSYALVLGLGAAAWYARKVGDAAMRRAQVLATDLRWRLETIPGVRTMDRGAELSAIVTVSMAGRQASELKAALHRTGINASVSQTEDGVLDMDAKGLSSVLRLSPHYYNTQDDLEAATDILAELAAG